MEESPDDSGRLFAETRRIPNRLEIWGSSPDIVKDAAAGVKYI